MSEIIAFWLGGTLGVLVTAVVASVSRARRRQRIWESIEDQIRRREDWRTRMLDQAMRHPPGEERRMWLTLNVEEGEEAARVETLLRMLDGQETGE